MGCSYEILPFLVPCYKTLFIALYHPYWGNSDHHSKTIDYLFEIINSVDCKSYDHICIAGDFNDLNLNFEHAFVPFKLKNVVSFPTRGTKTLDCIFTNHSNKYFCEKQAPIAKSDHCVVICKPYNNQPHKKGYTKKVIPDISPNNKALFEKIMSTTSFDTPEFINNGQDLNYYSSDIVQKLVSIFCYCFPLKTVKIPLSNKPWITHNIRLLIRKRNFAYKRGQSSIFRHLKIKVRDSISKAKADFLHNGKIPLSKKDWHNTKIAANLDSKQSDDCSFSPDDFITYFTSIFDCDPMNFNTSIVDLPENSILVTEIEVFKALSTLKKSGGVPYLPVWVYKNYAHILAKPLCNIFNASFSLGYIPLSFKFSNIIPVPKVRKPTSISQYRPITTTSPLLKILEKFVFIKWLMPLIHENTFKDQFAFVPLKGRGCQVALTYINGRILHSCDQNLQVDMLLVDLSKAFDKALFSSTIDVLADLGASKNLLYWIFSYFYDRQIRVNLQGKFSDFVQVSTGTPQGGIISPILFAFIMSKLIPLNDSTEYIKYADDLTVLHTYSQFSRLDSELNNINSWCAANNMTLNASKTKIMHFGNAPHNHYPSLNFNGNCINEVTSTLLLGIYFDSDHKWKSHTTYIVKKANKVLFHLICLKRAGCKRDTLVLFYNYFIRSILSYAFPAMCNITNNLFNLICKVEKRAFIIIGTKPEMHIKSFTNNQCLNLKKAVLSNPYHPLRKLFSSVQSSTRSNSDLCVPHGRSSRYINSFIKFFL